MQATIDNQQQETHKVFEHNQLLAEENARLKQQLDRTQQVVEDLSTTQKDRLAALSEQLTQQVGAAQAAGVRWCLGGACRVGTAERCQVHVCPVCVKVSDRTLCMHQTAYRVAAQAVVT